MNKYGMSMVEIIIGVILLALIVVPSLNVINTKTQTVTATRDHAQAAFVAQKIQEMARAFKFEFIEADRYASNPELQRRTFEWKLKNDEEFKKHNLNGIDYNIEDVAIDPVLNSEDPDPDQIPIVYLLQFTIRYHGKDNRDHEMSINTAISQRD
ncbi:MAG: hypothetical protein Kow0029_16260 [Candidatus Rifleibacteriota bacterium]